MTKILDKLYRIFYNFEGP